MSESEERARVAAAPAAPAAPLAARGRWRYEACIKDRDLEELVDLHWHRRLAFWLILKPIERGLSFIRPLHLTVLAIVVGLIGGYACSQIPTHGPLLGVWAGLLTLMHVVLDCSDGMLARVRGGGSFLGMLLDGISDAIVGFAVWLGCALAMVAEIDAWWGWPAAVAILLSILLHVALYDGYKGRFEKGVRPEVDLAAPASAEEQARQTALERFLERLIGGIYRSTYVALNAKVGGEEAPAVDPARFRRAFAAPMRLITWIGLGTNLALMYLSMMLVPLWPLAPIWIGLVLIVGLGNALTVWAILAWKRAERELRQGEPAPSAAE
ncbi:MAG: CDP-alcohol phosphatidyltransferase family protein [Myxococcales bacterium]|nr:CDP-alcohol phosphatidyltransferase family protein [Myxococcales bacterium]